MLFQAIAKALEGIYLDSGKELHRVIRVFTVTSVSALHQQLHTLLPGFRSPWGALLLLFSLLLSRGLVSVSFEEFIVVLWHIIPNQSLAKNELAVLKFEQHYPH